MAESLINIGIVAQQGKEMKVDGDFCDPDDYSSGSDRSLEADDIDGNVRCDLGSHYHQNNTEVVRYRRKRRHGSHGSRRHKGGSRHKPKGFQNYPGKDEVEMQLKRKSLELQEKENAAAVVRREGADQQIMIFPVAPFNSTQFLMDEHNAHSPATQHKTNSFTTNSCSSQDIRLSSSPSTPAELCHEESTFEKKDKEFTDFFATVHAESLQSLPKEELVKHYMNLEEKVAQLQKKVAEQQQRQDVDTGVESSRQMFRVCVYDSSSSSDTSSLSSSNEEFVDLSLVNQSSITVSAVLNTASESAATPICAQNDPEIAS